MKKILSLLLLISLIFTACKKEDEQVIISTPYNNVSGFYTNPFKLILTNNDDYKIHYTLDGSNPTIKSDVFHDYLLIRGCESYDSLSFIRTSNTSWTPPANRKYIAHATSYLIMKYILTSYDYSELISSKFSRWLFPYKQDQATIVRYTSFDHKNQQTETKTLSFFINKKENLSHKNNVIITKYKLPVISISTDKNNLFDHDKGLLVPGIHFNAEKRYSGNFFMKGRLFEREVFCQYFNDQGELNTEFTIGMRTHGGVTRENSQKSLRFYARDQYGNPNVELPLISKHKINRFILESMRESGGGQALIEDIVAQDIVKGIGLEQQNFHPVIVFINGEYWGLHTLRERIDENYLAYKFNTHKDSFDVIDGSPPNYDIINGNNLEYIKLLDFIKENDLSKNDNYNFVTNKIDVNNFINYYSVQLFFANRDWPMHNLKLWKKKNNGKWRFFLYDLDGGFSYTALDGIVKDHKINMFDRLLNQKKCEDCINSTESTLLFRNLSKNPQFKKQFKKQYQEIIDLYMHSDRTMFLTDSIMDIYDVNMQDHINRWGFPFTKNHWENDVESNIKNFLRNRKSYTLRNLDKYMKNESDH
jgi:hypothetical protein